MAPNEDPKNPAWVAPATHHPDAAEEAPGVPRERPVPSYGRNAAACLGAALQAAWDAVDDDLKDELKRTAIQAGRDAAWSLRATASVWAPKGTMIVKLALTAAVEALESAARA